VGQILKGEPPCPDQATTASEDMSSIEAAATRVVAAKYPNHVWHMDLTAVPIAGFWVPWLPFALPQVWPFCWWVAVGIDHFSRRVMGVAAFKRPPTFRQVAAFLRRTIRKTRAKPKYIISDKGPQFWCEGFKAWCPSLGISPRFGAVGKHGSIAVIERFIRSMKEEGMRRLLIPLRQRAFLQELSLYVGWYNEHRPHTTLRGATPNERYFGLRPANRAPRFEPRPHWPRGSPCAKPQVLIMVQPGARIELTVTFEGRGKHLPVVTLTRVA
jgi:transposase InsO family protein